MANNPGAKKRIRQNEKRRLRNRYKLVKARNLLKSYLEAESVDKAQELYPQVTSAIDKLVKANIIHRHKAARHKSQVDRHLNALKKEAA